MKRIVFLVCLTILTNFTFAQKNIEKVNVKTGEVGVTILPTMSVSEESFDFGKIPQGKPVHHNFVVTNNASSAYKLTNVQASCGCTTPEWEKDKLMNPGESSNINVGYNAAAEGNFTKSITITYCDTLSKVITIKGEVWKTPASSVPANTATQDLKDRK
jgi:hypothetical protein